MNTLKCPICGFSLEPGECAKPICPDCGGALHIFSDIYDPPPVMPDIMRQKPVSYVTKETIEKMKSELEARLKEILGEIKRKKIK